MESIFSSVKQPSVVKISRSYPVSVTLAFEQDFGDILAVTARAFLQDTTCGDGVVKIKGLTLFNILYKEEGKLCHHESGAQFTFDIENSNANQGCVGDIKVTANDVVYKKGESGVEVSAQILVEGYLYLPQEVAFLSDVDGATVKKEQRDMLNYVGGCASSLEISDEKNFNFFIEKVICHNEGVKVISATAGVNEIVVEGEIFSELIFLLKSGEVFSENIVTPFKRELDCELASPQYTAGVSIQVCERAFKVSANEEENSSQLEVDYFVRAFSVLFEKTAVNSVIDCFSCTNEVLLETNEVRYIANESTQIFKDKRFGEGDVKFEINQKIISTAFPTVEIASYNNESGSLKITGVVACVAISKVDNGEIVCTQAQFPFASSFETDGEVLNVVATVKNVTVRNLDGKCLAEWELEFTALIKSEQTATALTAVTEGQERKQKQSAISVVFINKGDDLWAVCKKALASEQVILSDNPGTTFPAKEDRAVVVYRKL